MAQAENDQDKVWELAKDISFCMPTTQSGNALRARPLSADADREAHAFYFLTDAASHKDEEIASHSAVRLAFANPKGQKYVSVSGTTEIQNDREKIKDSSPFPPRPGGTALTIRQSVC